MMLLTVGVIERSAKRRGDQNVTTTNEKRFAAAFEELRAALEARGKGFAPLLALVKPQLVPCQTEGMSHYVYAARYWEQAASGAWQGALRQALVVMCKAPTQDELGTRDLIEYIAGLERILGDTRTHATLAVTKWVKEMPGV